MLLCILLVLMVLAVVNLYHLYLQMYNDALDCSSLIGTDCGSSLRSSLFTGSGFYWSNWY